MNDFKLSIMREITTKISVESALCIIPPKSQWNKIQEIRKKHDPAYYRWMPHINILFPFIDQKYFNLISIYISNTIIKENNIKSFKIHLNSFDVFDRVKTNKNKYGNNNNVRNPNKMETLWLKPQGCYKELQKLFNLSKKEWMKCATKHGKQSKYIPHLTVGKFKIKEINRFKNRFQTSWKPISFQCDAIYLISRQGNEPFKIKHKLSLC